MDKITKLPDKPQKHPTRFVILPLKPYLAKFVQVDWRRIRPLISDQDIAFTREVWTRPKKLGRYHFPRIYEDEKQRERNLFHSIKIIAGAYFRMEIPQSCTYKDLKIQVYKNRKNLPEDLITFVNKGYTLLKITCPIYNKVSPRAKRLIDYQSYDQNINQINELLADGFYNYTFQKEAVVRNFRATIDEVFNVLGITEDHIRKGTVRRNLTKRKTELVRLYYFSFGEDSIHKKINNKKLWEIYRDHIEYNLSYSQLGQKYDHHKSMISRICRNEDVIKLYKEVSFDFDRFSDWHHKKMEELFSHNESE